MSLFGCITWEDPPVSDVPKLGTLDIHVYYTYKLKWKPLFDGWVLGVLHIEGQEKLAHQTQLEVTMYSKYTAHIR